MKQLHRLSGSMLILLVLSSSLSRPLHMPTVASTAPANPTFFARNYAGKCLDFSRPPKTGSTPVVIASCNNSRTQQVQVQEINARHEVILRAGSMVIGIHNLVVTKGGTLPGAPIAASAQYALELQPQANPVDAASKNQIFALDGDSILLASNRNLVVQVANSRGAEGTPLVVADRNLADSEFWDFRAADGSDKDPTSGFIRASTRDALLAAITQVNDVAHNNNGAAWGSVIKIIDTGVPIELSYNPFVFCSPNGSYQCSYDGIHNRFNVHNLLIPTGVTVRGDRRARLPGPLIHGNYGCEPSNGHDPCELDNVFQIQGDFARITGLRVQGPSHCVLDPDGCHSTNLPAVIGIQVGSRVSVEPAGDIVDHNDLFDWPEAAVSIASNLDVSDSCPSPLGSPPNYALVTRNFLHHNENNDGYGVGIYGGAGASITGNTFLMNRRSISGGDGEGHEQYDAAFNLVLSNVPVYGGNRESDFDMHAGSKVVIHSNTFLGGKRDNFALRGQPCGVTDNPVATPLDRFDFNMTMNSLPVSFHGNERLTTNPADHLGVGDFDGDGKDDLFLATGASWYYAPAGTTEWRFLNTQTDRNDHLLFGDFDADGRTDVFTQHGRDWLVSWGGASHWEKINASDAQMSDFAAGNFDDDPRADIFYADGHAWYMSSGGTAPFKPLAVSSFRVSDLRFGDFNKDGKTDVFGVTGEAWQVEYGGATTWQRLNGKLSDSVSGLIVADFNGDGYADIGRLDCSGGCRWQMSLRGRGKWISSTWTIGVVAAVGRFEGNRAANVLGWHVDFLEILAGTSTLPHRYSRNEMR